MQNKNEKKKYNDEKSAFYFLSNQNFIFKQLEFHFSSKQNFIISSESVECRGASNIIFYHSQLRKNSYKYYCLFLYICKSTLTIKQGAVLVVAPSEYRSMHETGKSSKYTTHQ